MGKFEENLIKLEILYEQNSSACEREWLFVTTNEDIALLPGGLCFLSSYFEKPCLP